METNRYLANAQTFIIKKACCTKSIIDVQKVNLIYKLLKISDDLDGKAETCVCAGLCVWLKVGRRQFLTYSRRASFAAIIILLFISELTMAKISY